MKRPYRLVTASEWLESHKETHPSAVHNTDKTEYILSLNDGSGDMTRDQAISYKSDNWAEVEDV